MKEACVKRVTLKATAVPVWAISNLQHLVTKLSVDAAILHPSSARLSRKFQVEVAG